MYIRTKFILFFVLSLLLSNTFLLSFETKVIFRHGGFRNVHFQQQPGFFYYYYGASIFRVAKDSSLKFEEFATYFSQITSFSWDKADTLWVGTLSGLYFSDRSATTTGFYEAIGIDIGNNITAIAVDSNNAKWVASSKGIYAIYENVAYLHFDIKDSLIKGNVNQIVVDRENNKYFISDNHYYKYDDTKIELFDSSKIPILKNSKKINDIAFDTLNNIFISTDAGTYCTYEYYNEDYYDILDTTSINSKDMILSNYHNSITINSDNDLIIGMGNYKDASGKGGVSFVSNEPYLIPYNIIMPYTKIAKVSLDENENLWLATYIYFYPETPFPELIVAVVNCDKIRYTSVNNSMQKAFIYPNPTQDVLNLTNIPDGAIDYEIVNQYGVRQLKGFVSEQIDVSQLPAGIYFLKLNNQTTPIKFIKL